MCNCPCAMPVHDREPELTRFLWRAPVLRGIYLPLVKSVIAARCRDGACMNMMPCKLWSNCN